MNRLRAYRDLEGLNQAELGLVLGISAPLVSAIESGRRPFNGDLTQLGYSPSRLELPPMTPPLHRVRTSTTVAAIKRAHETLRLAGEVFNELRALTPKTPSVAIERQVGATDQLEDYVPELRCILEHEESGPIRNLTAAVERAGVCLVPINAPGVDGLSSWVDGTPVIGLNPNVPGDRFRLTLGHELAHLMFHARKGDHTESEANQFASALLIPTPDFELAMPDRPVLRDFVNLKSSWGVSVAALVYRAHQLDYLDDARYRSLQIQMSKWQRNEPAAFPPVHGQLLPRLVEIHGGPRACATALGVNTSHMNQLINWSHLHPVPTKLALVGG